MFKYDIAQNTARLKSLYSSAPEEVQWYFEHMPRLIDEFPLDVALAYAFARVETAHNMALYCGVVKMYKANADLAWTAVERQHLTREGFRDLFRTIYGKQITAIAQGYIEEAERVRDKVMHGKEVKDQDKRAALSRVLHYAVKLNEQTSDIAGLKLFGRLQGFKGRAQSLDKETSRWLLRGLGLTLG